MIDTTKIVFASSIATDKLLGSYSSSKNGLLIATNPTPGTTTTSTLSITTNIAETTFVVGRFSIDNGTTWNGMEADVTHSDNNGDITVFAQSSSNQVVITAKNIRNSSAPVGAFAFTVLYDVMLLAKPDQGTVTPQPIGSKIYFDSRKNYQKIAFDTFQTFTGTNQTLTFTHNLGYVPRIRVFYEVSGVLRIRGGISSSQTTIDTTTVSVFMAGAFTNTKVYVRIYYHA